MSGTRSRAGRERDRRQTHDQICHITGCARSRFINGRSVALATKGQFPFGSLLCDGGCGRRGNRRRRRIGASRVGFNKSSGRLGGCDAGRATDINDGRRYKSGEWSRGSTRCHAYLSCQGLRGRGKHLQRLVRSIVCEWLALACATTSPFFRGAAARNLDVVLGIRVLLTINI